MSRTTRTAPSRAAAFALLVLIGAAAATTPRRWSAASMAGLGPAAPHDAIVLFDGSSWNGWKPRQGDVSPWIMLDDGSVQSHGGDAITRRTFADLHLHVEFLCPAIEGARGQRRANSGVFLHGRYELQILDSFGDPPSVDGCGAIYGLAQPLTNASNPAGQWQTFDVIFRAPRFDLRGSQVREPARMTVIHNGVVVQNNVLLPHTTPGGVDRELGPAGPIMLQDKGHQVRFRNIWARPL